MMKKYAITELETKMKKVEYRSLTGPEILVPVIIS
jgi:hypothetical protein